MPASRSRQADEDVVSEPEIPVSKTPPSQVGHPDEPESLDPEISTTASVLGLRTSEIEVERVPEAGPPRSDPNGFAVIRMNETLEDFTYGNQTQGVRLIQGRQYRVPVHIAQYLDGLGYVYH